jgi:hypothetical protein
MEYSLREHKTLHIIIIKITIIISIIIGIIVFNSDYIKKKGY